MPEVMRWRSPLLVLAWGLCMAGACTDQDPTNFRPDATLTTPAPDPAGPRGTASTRILDANIERDAAPVTLDAGSVIAAAPPETKSPAQAAGDAAAIEQDAGTVDGSVDRVADANVLGQEAGFERARNDGGLLPLGCTALIEDEACDRQRPPIVFVHGRLGAGDHFANPAALFASNGYCADLIRAVDYDSTAGDDAYAQVASELDLTIARVLEATGAPKVDIVAHSQGAAYATRYVAANERRVAHYIHIAGERLSENPGGVPTLCLSSTGDAAVNCSNTSANVVLNDGNLDRFAIAASREAFVELYRFLNAGRSPQYDTVQCASSVTIEARAVNFGDNTPVAGATIELYELGSNARTRGAPLQSWQVPSDGQLGPWQASRDIAYEFKLIAPASENRAPRHVYLPPLKRSDRLLRLLFASKDADASSASRQVNYDDSHAVLVLKRRAGAFLAGRDRLLIGGTSVLTSENAGPTMTTIALYLFDAAQAGQSGPGDGQSSGGALVIAPYVSGSDLYLRADVPAFIDVVFNGQRLRVPNWPSKTEGLSLVLLD